MQEKHLLLLLQIINHRKEPIIAKTQVALSLSVQETTVLHLLTTKDLETVHQALQVLIQDHQVQVRLIADRVQAQVLLQVVVVVVSAALLQEVLAEVDADVNNKIELF